MYYTIYKITNNLNGKIYIGKHQTNDINDDYMGSGKAIKNAIRKYGKNSFYKEILFIYDNEVEMNLKEKELITEEFIQKGNTYNTGVGGEGGPHFKGKTHSLATKNKIALISRSRTHSLETRKKISDSNRTRIIKNDTKRKISEKAKERFLKEDAKLKISNSLKQHYNDNIENKKVASLKMIEIMKNQDNRKKLSTTMKEKYSKIYSNLIWIKNNITKECLRINKNDFEKYVKIGFELGRIKSY